MRTILSRLRNAHGSIVTGAGMASSSLSTLAATVVVVAYSTPAVVADTAILNVAILFGSVLLRFGADRLMVPEVRLANATSKEAGRDAGARILAASVLVAAFGVLLAYFSPILSWVTETSLSDPLTGLEQTAIAVWLFSEILRLVAAEGHRANEQFVLASAAGFGLRAPAFLAILLASALRGDNLYRETVIFSASLASALIASLALCTISSNFPWWRAAPLNGLRRMWRANTWMLTTTMAGTIVGGTHIWVAGAAFHPADVAPYAFANTLVSGLAIVSTAINGGLSPRIASLVAAGDLPAVQHVVVSYVRGAVGLTLVALAALVLAGPEVATLLGGAAYQDIGTFLLILGIGQAVSCGAGLSGWVLMAARRYRFVALSSAAVAVAVVILCVLAAFVVHSPMFLAIVAALGTAALPLANNAVSARSMGVRTDVIASRKRAVWES